MNPILAKALAILVSLGVSFLFGVLYEHGNLQEFKGETKGAASAQTQQTKATDTKNEGDANAAQQSYTKAINDLDAYYHAHPVIRVRHDGSCALPQASGNTQGADATPTGGYASPYSPRDTELIAERLYELQNRLRDGGVTVR